MEGILRYHIYLTPKKLLKVNHETCGKPGRMSRADIYERIHVALWTRLTSRHRAKDAHVMRTVLGRET